LIGVGNAEQESLGERRDVRTPRERRQLGLQISAIDELLRDPDRQADGHPDGPLEERMGHER
jgi:hypothetical protein